MDLWRFSRQMMTATILFFGSPALGGVNSPMDDAVAVWHMASAKNSADEKSALQVHGEVRLGVELTSAEREASLRRGGEAKVAVFRGGYCDAGQGAGGKLNLRGQAMSLAIRLRDASGRWGRSILSKYGGGHNTLSYNLFSTDLGGMAIGFELGTTVTSGMYQVRFPVSALIDPDGWHDIVVRYDGNRLEIFVDGVLVDRRRAAGDLRQNNEPCIIGGHSVQGRVFSPFQGEIDHAALWQRALSDGEIVQLSGGQGAVERRKVEMNGVAFREDSYPEPPYSPGVLAKYAAAQLAVRREILAKDPHRPVYHFQAPRGWMNDPNGPIYWKGEYHLFYQFNPGARGGQSPFDAICWGHAKSKDLVHWTDLPIAMHPDTPWDRGGVFSGNTAALDDNTVLAVYTGNVSGHGHCYAVLATSTDGLLTWKKRCAIDKPPYPGTPVNWDAQIWKDGETWYLLSGGCFQGGGAAVLWSSPDLVQWAYRNRIYATNRDGGFWELPYLVPLGNRYVLVIGVWPVRYWVGTYDKQKLVFRPDREEAAVLDYSPTYYSPNLNMVDDKGPGGTPRRLMHGWILHGTTTRGVPYWEGMHSVPRVLTLENNQLIQRPIPEIAMCRGRHWRYAEATIDKPSPGLLKNVRGDALEIIATFDRVGCTAKQFGLNLRMSADGKQKTVVYFDAASGNMGTAGMIHNGGHRGPAGLAPGEPVRMHVLLDRSVLEFFINGRAVTERVFPDPSSLSVDVFAEGGKVELRSIDVWEMRSIWGGL
jgi:beta-fructofuranosidase